ncbi:MAG: trypsin-like peptidase domain-containing protein [Deferribacteres bacterium]|nr:trypsin-like peptidase domain-containing protein [candidate division KSB1 bacterium]MCB9510450.1 trypsin-like peptidase domain-containing protein [Deferribacteres bacterium]
MFSMPAQTAISQFDHFCARSVNTIIVLFALTILTACGSVQHHTILERPSNKFASEVQKVMPSVIEVVSLFEYDVHEYHYALDAAGNFIPDDTSRFGFRMLTNDLESNVSVRVDRHMAFGSGVVIGENGDEYLVLTNRHIVVRKDSLVDYIHIDGKPSQAPLYRALLSKHELAIRGLNNSLVHADLLVQDGRYDLAMLTVQARKIAAVVLPVQPAFYESPEPGRLAVMIGFPDEIRQAAIGLTGEAPYPGNFSISTYGDFGYSGGGVFAGSDDGDFVFIGIGRSIPAKTVSYVAPSEDFTKHYGLAPEDLRHLRIENMNIVNPSRMFAITIKQISTFIKKNYNLIASRRFELNKKFLN